MHTQVLTDVQAAARLLGAGRLVAFPTETVYGLGADALNAQAVAAIFRAKGRPADNPLILHVRDVAQAEAIAEWNPVARALAARYWPGPLTVVLPSRPVVPEAARGGLPTVAIRAPSHPLAAALIAALGRPVAAPSANRSGRPSPTTAEAVLEDLRGQIDAVLDGGPCPLGLESTVVDCTGPQLRLLRPGAIAAEELGLDPVPSPNAPARSPGMRHRHYAPRLPLYVVQDVGGALAARPGAAVLCTPAAAARLGLTAGPRVEVLPADARGRAAALYAALRRLERSGACCILAEALPAQGLDAAVMDRLWRGAAAIGVPCGPEESGGAHEREGEA